MPAYYDSIGIFLLIAALFASALVFIPFILRRLGIIPSKPTTWKAATYECGVQTTGKTWVQFNFRYYFYALIFVALDVLVVFLYPWAVELKSLGFTALIMVLVLLFIVSVGYIYAWKKKVLEWR